MRALVYVDAFAPDEGETVFQILGGSGSALDVPDPTAVLDIVGYPGGPEGDAEAFLKPDTVHNSFAQDLPEADRWLIVESQRPITLSANTTPVRRRRPGRPCRAGRSSAPRTGSSRRTRSAAWPSARARRSPRWPARTSRWCRTPRRRSTRSWPPSPLSATDAPAALKRYWAPKPPSTGSTTPVTYEDSSEAR